MPTEKEKIYALLRGGTENMEIALQILKGQPQLKKEIEQELLPILKTINKNTLRFLPTLLRNINKIFPKVVQEGKAELWLRSPFIQKSLTELDLRYSRLQELPDSIGMLSHLTILRVNGNKLQELPNSIGSLSHLVELDLSKNRLQKVPDSVGMLNNLAELDLSKNQLQKVPDSVGCLLYTSPSPRDRG